MVSWLSLCSVVLDADSLVAADYGACATPLPSFSCASPYGTPALPGARVRCKRRRSCSDSVRAAREAEAEARHETALPALQAALGLYKSSLTTHATSGARALLPAPVCADSLPELVLSAEAGAPAPTLHLSAPTGVASAPLVGCVHANTSASVATARLGTQAFLLPPCSRVALSSAASLPALLPSLGTFTLLILDPPWEAVSPARGATYAAMTPNSLAALPVRQLCCPAGALVAVWVTNRERVRRLLYDRLFPAWGLTLMAEWRWLKVTRDGHSVLPLQAGAGSRRPYELLVLARSGEPCRTDVPLAVTLLSQPGPHSRKPRLFSLCLLYTSPSPRD
jgi:N6-adenosine-specific RNA methylase IME4